ncbi:MAG: hypothetical protein AAFS02_09625 [Pseudomonadota bacterium]
MMRIPHAAMMLVALLVAGCGSEADSDSEVTDAAKTTESSEWTTGRQATATVILDVPETGIELGWGYNAFDDRALPHQCIQFAAAEEPAQTRTMSMKEVSDTYELMKRMNVSAEASVKTMGFEGSGKASFAKSVNMSGSSITFVLDAAVDNGVRFAAPYSENAGAYGAGAAVRLTAAAERLARDPEEFLRQCGSGYVSAVYSGARLTAVISMKTTSQSNKETIRTEVRAKGWGATGKVSGGAENQSATRNAEKTMSVFLVGGRGDAIPRDQDGVEAKLDTLSYSAYEAPKDFRMAVTPYESLPNWPQTKPVSAEPTEFEQLAGLWGDYSTLYDELELILEQPAQYAAISRSTEEGKMFDVLALAEHEDALLHLERVQDALWQGVHELEAIARQCLEAETEGIEEGENCNFDENRFVPSHAFRAQLPLELAERPPATQPEACGKTPADAVACTRAVIQESAVALEADTPLDRRVVERWIIEKSRSRCRLDLLDIGCLSNAEVRHWQTTVGTRLMLLDDEERTAVAGLNLVLDIDDKTGAVWLLPAQANAVVAAIKNARRSE